MIFALVFILGFVIGGMPTGIIICRAVKGVDPRGQGSGSMGATNVSRILGKPWAAVVLLIDILKGFLPVFVIAPLLAPTDGVFLTEALLATGLVSGHVWTPYAGFRGGKGVGTAAGVMIAISPAAVLLAFGLWLVVFALVRIVSLASIIASLSLPVMVWVWGRQPRPYIVLAAVFALFIAFTHRQNIRRLMRGEEGRFK